MSQAQALLVAVTFQLESRVALAEQAIARQSQEFSAVQQEAHARLTNAELMVAQKDRDLVASQQLAADRVSQMEGLLAGKDPELAKATHDNHKLNVQNQKLSAQMISKANELRDMQQQFALLMATRSSQSPPRRLGDDLGASSHFAALAVAKRRHPRFR